MKFKKHCLISVIIGFVIGVFIWIFTPSLPYLSSNDFTFYFIYVFQDFLYNIFKISILDLGLTFSRVVFLVSFLLISAFWGLVIGLIIRFIKNLYNKTKNE